MIRLLRVLTTMLAVIGLGTTAGWVWTMLRTAPAPNNVTVSTSLDGRFKAVVASWDGGAAMASFCTDRVYVASTTVPNNLVVDERNLVFEGGCSSFDDHSLSPKVRWLPGQTLGVAIALPRGSDAPTAVRLRHTAAGGQVVLDFEVDR